MKTFPSKSPLTNKHQDYPCSEQVMILFQLIIPIYHTFASKIFFFLRLMKNVNKLTDPLMRLHLFRKGKERANLLRRNRHTASGLMSDQKTLGWELHPNSSLIKKVAVLTQLYLVGILGLEPRNFCS